LNPLIRYNPLRLLNSVPFGISLMVGIGLYIAGGSARPWFREAGWDQIPGLGAWFDETDMQFFDAWPLKIMIGLLVANLVVVTWRRIPLTPPRYGVWCIHSGIITLVLSTAVYYHLKVEGRVRIYTNPAEGPNTVSDFYDKDERSLYIKVGNDLPQEIALPDLPRMKGYDVTLGNEVELTARKGLQQLEPTIQARSDGPAVENYGVSEKWGHPVYFDVVGYFPYANVATDFVQKPTGGATGIEIDSSGISEETRGQFYVMASDWRFAAQTQFQVAFRHVELPTVEAIDNYRKSAAGLFHLTVSTNGTAGPAFPQIDAQPGGTYVFPGGYTIKVLNYNPSFPMRETGKMVSTMMLAVTTPTQKFQRVIIEGNPKQTDFRLGDDGRPMGMGAKLPLDPSLILSFSVDDPLRLLPQATPAGFSTDEAAGIQHTLITAPNQPGFTDIVTGYAQPVDIREIKDANGEDMELDPMASQPQGPFSGGGDDQAAAPHAMLQLHLKRMDHLVPVDEVRVVPKSKRNNDLDESGRMQVIRVRVQFGDYSQDVLVPFSAEAYEGVSLGSDPDIRWQGGLVQLPGVPSTIRLQLGNRRRPLPAELTLDKFEAIPYPGLGNSFLDYKSTVTISTPVTPDGGGGETMTGVASANHPIYYDHGNWLFFQAAYDGSDKKWTELGVGNRPFVNMMVCGCVMIFVGLMYAFYAKPLIIRKMKQNALAAAAARKVPPPLPVAV
jgi:hypothetical protein